MTASTCYPLLARHAPEATFAWWQNRPVSTRRFIQQVQQVAARLPEAGYAINLCEDRYLFLVGFVALLLRRQVNLLPPNRARRVVEAVAADYPGSYCLVDKPLPELELAQHLIAIDEAALPAAGALPELQAEQIVATVFTSGSTGQARANSKCWGELYLGAQETEVALGLPQDGATVVATVPPQHMFGLETSVILPLVTALSVHGSRPFFPDDLRRVLAGLQAPVALVTTPVHLRTCSEAGLDWPSLELILSATAPLAVATAARAEQLFACEVHEIYGSTETGAIATRRTIEGERWQLHPDLALQRVGDGVQVSGGHLSQPVTLNDALQLMPDGRFTLEGRHSDMIKIAGKRASLGDLNLQLQSVPGIEDGVFVVPEADHSPGTRLMALVVAPQLETAAIQSALQERLDPVFLPRPIYRVERLPRNETGKLPREAVLGLLESLRKR
jgi:acyl-coenzyme A synthetase/AMP-(fatty) acid ligase